MQHKKKRSKNLGIEENIKEYRKSIENLIDDLMPRVNKPLAVLGFLLAVLGIASIAIVSNTITINGFLPNFYIEILFFLFLIAFVGYMLIHKSTEHDWL